MFRGLSKKYILLCILGLILLPSAMAIGNSVKIHHGAISGIEYIMITNPAGQNITTTIRNSDNNVIFTDSTTNTTVTYNIDQYGSYTVKISIAGVTLADGNFGFTLGSVIDTGFKATLQKEFGTNLFLVGITILFGVALFGITIGRYVALPLVLATVGILSIYNYIPSWISYIIILIAAFMLAQAISGMIRQGGG